MDRIASHLTAHSQPSGIFACIILYLDAFPGAFSLPCLRCVAISPFKYNGRPRLFFLWVLNIPFVSVLILPLSNLFYHSMKFRLLWKPLALR